MHSNPQKATESRGFTLIELLVVIAIIAILAAILFPVFAQAKLAAKKAVDISNEKQIALGAIMYANDYDDKVPIVSNFVAIPGSSGVYARHFWWYDLQVNYNTSPITTTYEDGGLLYPYMKNVQIQASPGVNQINPFGPNIPAQNIAENSYLPGTPLSSFDAPASTIMLADAGAVYSNNGGYANYSEPSFTSLCFVSGGKLRCPVPMMQGRWSNGICNLAWSDGHVKSKPITPLGYYTKEAAYPAYVAALMQYNEGWVAPPGVTLQSDPLMACYYAPTTTATLTRPSNCPN